MYFCTRLCPFLLISPRVTAMASYRYFRDKAELYAFLDEVKAEGTGIFSGEVRINKIRTYYNNVSLLMNYCIEW